MCVCVCVCVCTWYTKCPHKDSNPWGPLETCVCVCGGGGGGGGGGGVCVFWYRWFIRTQMCVTTWVLQSEHGL